MEDDVAQVHVGLPVLERLLSHLVQAQHGLQLGAVALLEGRKAQLARVPGEHHTAGHADDVAGRGVRGELRIGRPQLSEGVGARHLDRIRVAPLGQQPLTLGLADAELLGNVGAVGFAHEMPA